MGRIVNPMMIVDNDFDIGAIVYLKTDPDQCARIVTRLGVGPTGVIYYLALGSVESSHYAMEITAEKNVSIVG